MSNAASGLAHLKVFLPGLEPLLEDGGSVRDHD